MGTDSETCVLPYGTTGILGAPVASLFIPPVCLPTLMQPALGPKVGNILKLRVAKSCKATGARKEAKSYEIASDAKSEGQFEAEYHWEQSSQFILVTFPGKRADSPRPLPASSACSGHSNVSSSCIASWIVV